ncbi:thioesterase II family protein [Streptomyces yangpuensis]|uniref:thioesterase II family protein n=1 Tax=Streptomyces yangpuensis TaxID=1648182 RepID=UPI0038140A0F
MVFVRLSRLKGNPLARMYLFPHAGGSPSEYSAWGALSDCVEFVGVQLPGRGARFHEPSVGDVKRLAADIASAVSLEVPFGFFGHSFGSLLAFETCRALRASGKSLPAWLWVSAFPAPDRIPSGPILSTKPASELLKELSDKFGAIPEEILEDDELVELVGEYLKADYQALETYEFQEQLPLELSLTVLAPVDDDYREAGRLAEWKRHGARGFQLHEFTGGHFYLREPMNLERIGKLIIESV